jgi:hypothetical protein
MADSAQISRVTMGVAALLNIFAGKYISEELELFDKKVCGKKIFKKFLIFVPIYLVTNDPNLSLIIGLSFLIINEII